MKIFWIILSAFLWIHISQTSAKPFTDDDGDNFFPSDTDARRKHKNRRRPCQKSANGERTFFQVSYVDVNYNYNCDEASFNTNQRPQHSKPQHNRPHNRPQNKPQHDNNQNSNKPMQNHNGNDATNAEEPQNALGNDPVGFSTTRRPHRPLANFIMNHNGAFIQTFFNNLFGNNQKVESKPIPVHEDIVSDVTTKFEPGLYVSAYNPLTGQYLQNNVTNPKRIFRRIDKGIDYFLSPLYDLI